MPCHSPFLVVPYIVNRRGLVEARLPNKCPLWEKGDEGCCLVRKGYRIRKTIRAYRLCIFLCRQHGRKFTAYPPGYAPFLRKPLALIAPNGVEVQTEHRSEIFRGTLLQAAIDAARGKTWPSRSMPMKPCQRTQERHLSRLASLLGLATRLDAKTREWIGETFEVPGMISHDRQRSVDKDPGFRNLAVNVWGLSCKLTNKFRDYERLLVGGYLSGQWGRPHVACCSLTNSGIRKLGPEYSRAGPEIVNSMKSNILDGS